MTSPERHVEVSQYICELREKSHVPLGILYYDIKKGKLRLALAEDVGSVEEAKAILDKFGMSFDVEKKS